MRDHLHITKMQISKDIKTEFFATVCYACLSSFRTLEPLGVFKEVYQKICGGEESAEDNILFCWECRGLLKRVKKFSVKVQLSQRILNDYAHNEKLPKSLSNLSTSKTLLFDSLQPIETLPQSVQEPEIKQEIDDIPEMSDDVPETLDDIHNLNYELIDEVKEEDLSESMLSELKTIKKKEPKIKKNTKTRTKHYKKIYQSCKGKIVKRKAIDASEVDYWRERERNSVFFKSLRSKCDMCLCKLKIKNGIEDHMKHFHEKTKQQPYICNICQQTLPSKVKLEKHVTDHYTVLQCSACGYQCYGRDHMRCHTSSHKMIVQCLYCPGSYENVRVFHDHYRDAHCKFICDYCNKKCASKRVIEKHISRHHTKVQCKICNITFKKYNSYEYHKRLKHYRNPTEESFCVQCNIQFENIAVFKRHLSCSVAHASERRDFSIKKEKIPCPKCPNVYARKCNMLNHYRMVHTDQKNDKYYCTECNKFFLNRTRYKEHQKYSHEGCVPRKDKLCSFCGRGFSTNRILTNHIRTHTGERPFQCTYCDSKFTQKVALQSHIRFIHLKAKRKDDI